MKPTKLSLGLALVLASTAVNGCNTFIGADDPDVLEADELQPGQENDDLDDEDSGEPAATCGDGIVNSYLDADDNPVIEECDDGNADDKDGCDRCQVICGENNTEGGKENELESADHHCYRFVWFVDPKDELDSGLDYKSAEAACESWIPGGLAHLVVIDSPDEFIDVQNGVMHFPGGGATAWLGAKDVGGSFEWMIDETKVATIDPNDKHWAPGEPRDAVDDGVNPPEELCVAMDGEQLGYVAANCEAGHFYVCELDRPGTVPTPPEDGGP